MSSGRENWPLQTHWPHWHWKSGHLMVNNRISWPQTWGQCKQMCIWMSEIWNQLPNWLPRLSLPYNCAHKLCAPPSAHLCTETLLGINPIHLSTRFFFCLGPPSSVPRIHEFKHMRPLNDTVGHHHWWCGNVKMSIASVGDCFYYWFCYYVWLVY